MKPKDIYKLSKMTDDSQLSNDLVAIAKFIEENEKELSELNLSAEFDKLSNNISGLAFVNSNDLQEVNTRILYYVKTVIVGLLRNFPENAKLSILSEVEKDLLIQPNYIS